MTSSVIRVCLLCCVVALMAAAERPSVLVLMSYHRGMPWEDGVALGLQEVLADRYELVYVHHDVKRFPDRNRVPGLLDVTKSLIRDAAPRLVIAVDDYAWDLAVQHRQELFPKRSIVFCGVNYWDGTTRVPGTTGVVEGADPAATVRLALRMRPAARRVVVVNDRTETGQANRRLIETELPPVLDRRELVWLGDDTFARTSDALAHLDPEQDLVLVMSSNLDAAGAVRSYAEAAEAIRAACRTPVFAAWDLYYDRRFVGGYLLDAKAHGRRAGEMALCILTGADPDLIPVDTRPTVRLSLDARELDRYGIARRLVPAEAELLHDTPSFWAVHGTTILIAATIIALQGATIAGLLATMRRRRQAEAKARTAEERLRHGQRMDAIGQLAAGIAHDFNNVLTAMMGHAELLRIRLARQPELVEHARIIVEAAGRAAGTVRGLLTFARGHGREQGACELDRLAGDTVELLRHSIPRRIVIACEARSERWVGMDGDHLQQVLVNLALNARDAMPGNGRLDLATTAVNLDPAAAEGLGIASGAYALITVTDTGGGIDAAHLQRIFEPFFTTKPLGAGTGLGLAMVHGAVRSAGGAIRVTSTPGAGTTFHIWLPVTVAGRRRSTATSSIPATTRRVLLVDDDPLVLDTTAALLREAGCEVIAVRDPQQAEAALDDRITIAVLDGDMPQLPGWELARRLLAHRKDLPIIALTGVGTDASRALWHAAGVERVLDKPISLDALARALDADQA